MSNISELRKRVDVLEANVDELHTRISLLENVILKLTEEAKGIQAYHSDRHEIGDVRPPIGFKK